MIKIAESRTALYAKMKLIEYLLNVTENVLE